MSHVAVVYAVENLVPAGNRTPDTSVVLLVAWLLQWLWCFIHLWVRGGGAYLHAVDRRNEYFASAGFSGCCIILQ